MANDRLSLGCTRCGLRVTVLKYFPTSTSTLNEGLIGVFLREHLENCHPRMFQMDLGADSGFIIVTEEGESLLDDIVKIRASEDTVKT